MANHRVQFVSAADSLSKHAHWALRLALAGVFVYHGASKFIGWPQFPEMMQLPYVIAFLVALAELGGGLLVLAGSFTRDWITRLGAAMIIPVMLGAIVMVHWGQWNFVPSETHPMGGMEFQVTLLLVALYLVLRGNKA
jgi:putative oxidoreductase